MQKDTLSFAKRTTRETATAVQSRPQLGVLLLNAELLNQQSLNQALSRARQAKQPLGRVLVMLGMLSEHDLQLALEAQSMVEKNSLLDSLAAEVLNWAARRHIAIADALTEINDVRRRYEPTEQTNELGELLIAAQVLDKQMVWAALRRCRESDVLLGRYLLINRLCPIGWLSAALHAIVLKRDKTLTHDDAVQLLKIVVSRKVTFEGALGNLKIINRGASTNRIKIGDLLMQADVITETQRIEAVERALIENKPTGQVLVESGIISQSRLDEILLLQGMNEKGVLSQDQAREVLRKAHVARRTLSQILEETKVCHKNDPDNEEVLKLLIESGLVAFEDISKALWETNGFGMDAMTAILFTSTVSKQAHAAALQCLSLVRSKRLEWNDATRALQYCERGRCCLDDALLELGIQQHKLDEVSKNIHLSKPGGKAFIMDGSWRYLKEFKALAAVLILSIVIVAVVLAVVPKACQIYAWGAQVLILFVSIARFCMAFNKMRKQQEELGQLRISNASRRSTAMPSSEAKMLNSV